MFGMNMMEQTDIHTCTKSFQRCIVSVYGLPSFPAFNYCIHVHVYECLDAPNARVNTYASVVRTVEHISVCFCMIVCVRYV